MCCWLLAWKWHHFTPWLLSFFFLGMWSEKSWACLQVFQLIAIKFLQIIPWFMSWWPDSCWCFAIALCRFWFLSLRNSNSFMCFWWQFLFFLWLSYIHKLYSRLILLTTTFLELSSLLYNHSSLYKSHMDWNAMESTDFILTTKHMPWNNIEFLWTMHWKFLQAQYILF